SPGDRLSRRYPEKPRSAPARGPAPVRVRRCGPRAGARFPVQGGVLRRLTVPSWSGYSSRLEYHATPDRRPAGPVIAGLVIAGLMSAQAEPGPAASIRKIIHDISLVQSGLGDGSRI